MAAVAEKVIGILGGMGPESTAELLLRITRATPAKVEQDHLRVVIDCNPKIPNRTEALLSGEVGPVVAALADTARNLARAGAQVIGIACNTAHAFLPEIRAAVKVPVLDMVEEAARAARARFGEGAVVGLLATDGTLRTRLFQEALDRAGLVGIGPPTPGVQNAVMDALDAVKLHGPSEEAYRVLALAVRDLVAQDVRALIAGCTEVSLVLTRYPPELPWLDSVQVLAEALVREARGGR